MKLSLSALLVGSRQTPRARVLVFRPCVIVHLGYAEPLEDDALAAERAGVLVHGRAARAKNARKPRDLTARSWR